MAEVRAGGEEGGEGEVFWGRRARERVVRLEGVVARLCGAERAQVLDCVARGGGGGGSATAHTDGHQDALRDLRSARCCWNAVQSSSDARRGGASVVIARVCAWRSGREARRRAAEAACAGQRMARRWSGKGQGEGVAVRTEREVRLRQHHRFFFVAGRRPRSSSPPSVPAPLSLSLSLRFHLPLPTLQKMEDAFDGAIGIDLGTTYS